MHRDGLHQCNQNGKTFNYQGSPSNYVKKHSNTAYVCKHEGCDKESRSYHKNPIQRVFEAVFCNSNGNAYF